MGKPKLKPGFMTERPEIWFIMAEAVFDIASIVDDRIKYVNVIRELDATTNDQLADVIRKEPATEKYHTLKTAILSRLFDSRQKQVHKLISETTLDEKTPSQLLRKMRELANGTVDDCVLQSLWLDRLPPNIKPHLITTSNFRWKQ